MIRGPDDSDTLGVRPAQLYVVDAALASRVAAPAYDSLTAAEREALAAADPLSYLNVLYTHELDGQALRTALRRNSATLQQMLHDAVFDAGAGPRFAWYRLAVDDHVQTGLVAELAVADYDAGRILRHEHTRADKEQELAAHLEVVAADSSPVSVAFRADDGLDALARRCTDRPPDVEFTAPDGVTHAVWITERPGDIADICAAVRRLDRLYITDGHHRFAAASRVAAAGRRAGHGPDAADQWLLACLFAHDDLRILPFHRTVPRPPGATGGELLATLRRHVRVRPLAGPQPPAAPHTFSAYLDGAWYALSVPSAAVGADPLGQLDVVALQDAVLAPVFGVVEPRRDPRLGYIAGDVTTLAAHCARSARMGFALRPTGMEELMAVAEAGHAMPPKSTRFDPKTRAGIFVRLLR